MQESFRYGWVADTAEVEAYIEECVRTKETDQLNAGARAELVRQVVRRSFVRDGEQWLRRPTLDEIAVVSGPDSAAAVYPSIDLYDAIRCPTTFVMAARGFYAAKSELLDSVVAAAPNRIRVDVDSNHNVPMTRPAELADIISEVVLPYAARS
jgi:hypothetical protein